jgi:hypothetical protein
VKVGGHTLSSWPKAMTLATPACQADKFVHPLTCPLPDPSI